MPEADQKFGNGGGVSGVTGGGARISEGAQKMLLNLFYGASQISYGGRALPPVVTSLGGFRHSRFPNGGGVPPYWQGIWGPLVP